MPDVSPFLNPSLRREGHAVFGLKSEETFKNLSSVYCVYINLAKISKRRSQSRVLLTFIFLPPFKFITKGTVMFQLFSVLGLCKTIRILLLRPCFLSVSQGLEWFYFSTLNLHKFCSSSPMKGS